MQDQVTSSAPAGQPATSGRFVFTAILHGAADAIDNAFRAFTALLPTHNVAIVQASTVGPLPASDERNQLPVLPPFSPSGATQSSPAAATLDTAGSNRSRESAASAPLVSGLGIVGEIGSTVAEVVGEVASAEPAIAAGIATAEQVIGTIAPAVTDSTLGQRVEHAIADVEQFTPSVEQLDNALKTVVAVFNVLAKLIHSGDIGAAGVLPPAPAAALPPPVQSPEVDTRAR